MKYEIFIGSNNKTHALDKTYINKTIDIIKSFINSFSVEFGQSVYNGINEEYIKIIILGETINENILIAISTKLKLDLKQYSILINVELNNIAKLY